MKRAILILVTCLAVIGLLTLASCGKKNTSAGQETFALVRGPLDITVLESGTLDTAVSTHIIQNVRRNVKVLEIVDEGTIITEQDVADKKVLIKFESKDLEDEVYDRTTSFENAEAACTKAEEDLAIQKNDNDANIRAAELNLMIAENDFRKLVGETLAARLMKSEPENVKDLLNDKDLGGEARQQLTNYRGEIELAQIKLNRSIQKLEYTRKLYDKQFVSKNELETDELEVETQRKALTKAQGNMHLFQEYDFVKDFAKTLATVIDCRHKLERAQAVARSKLVACEAQLRSQRQNLQRETKRLEESKESLANCTVYAEAPGMVVYEAPPRWMNTGPMRPGTETRNHQTIIRMPDLNQMTVKVNIHESQVDMISVGMPAVITVDAMPGRTFKGKVSQKAILPSAQNQWLNPDLKVYETIVAFDESDQNLRPGMNATVEIIVEKLSSVMYVPSQAVRTNEKGQHFCFRADGKPVQVVTGKRNRVFVIIEEGLAVGDRVLVSPPELPKSSDDGDKDEKLELPPVLQAAQEEPPPMPPPSDEASPHKGGGRQRRPGGEGRGPRP